MWALSASILGCKHAAIGEAVRRAEKAGAQYIHIDVMDGDYVDNLTFGPQLVRELGELCSLPLSLHLETNRPDRYFRLFRDTPIYAVSFQMDACPNPLHLIREIRMSGKKVGLGIGPAIGLEPLRYVLPHLDSVTVMSVEPGYGGQVFEPSVYEKLRHVRRLSEELGHPVTLCVDGGVDTDKVAPLLEAGADVLICGTSVFRGDRIEENIAALLKSGGSGRAAARED